MITEYQKIECFKYITKRLAETDRVSSFEFIMMTIDEEVEIHPELLDDSTSALCESVWGVMKFQLHYRAKALTRTL